VVKRKKRELITLSLLAERTGCHPSAVDKACRQGRVPRERSGKVDWLRKEVQDFVTGYRARKAEKAAAQARGKAAVRMRRGGEHPYTNKATAEVARMNEQIIKLRLANETNKKTLIKRSAITVIFQKWYSIYAAELYPLGERIAPELISITGASQADAGIRIAEAIKTEIARTVKHMERLLADVVKEMMSDGDTDPEEIDEE
jgi:hypothetical protein